MAASDPTGSGQARRKSRQQSSARKKQGVRKKRPGADAENVMIGKRVKEFREKVRLTQREFGARLSVTRAAVGHWERGRGIQRQVCQEISRVFGASLEWLLMGGGQARPIMPGSLEEYMAGLPAEMQTSLDHQFRLVIDHQHTMLGTSRDRDHEKK